MNKTLYLLCGVPGSGKSTWVRKQMAIAAEKNITAVTVSRDAVRFSLLTDGEDYFAQEDKVFKTFIQLINEYLEDSVTDAIFVDATHLNEKGRNKVLDRLKLKEVNVVPVNFNVSLGTCLSQNELRRGIGRTYVPRDQIEKMFYAYSPARVGEKHEYANILEINER